jgi:hypothetical protein
VSDFQSYKAEQARISRVRLYPLTAFYVSYTIITLAIVARSAHPWIGLAAFGAGLPVWTLVEYLFHRYVLHGRFPKRESRIGQWMHDRLDPLHWEHHQRPFDGLHISGQLSDLIGLFVVAALFSWFWPSYTAPALLAGVVFSYVVEEWVHHSVHFYDFRNRYFRYIQKHHRYHHSQEGMDLGYGLTSDLWDHVFETQYPAPVREALFRRTKSVAPRATGRP